MSLHDQVTLNISSVTATLLGVMVDTVTAMTQVRSSPL